MSKEKHKLRAPNSDALKIRYQEIIRKVKKKIKTEMLNLERKIANNSKNNPKLVYAYTKSKQDIKDQIRALTVNNCTITDRKEIADALNKQFKSVFVKEVLNESDELPYVVSRRKDAFGTKDLEDCFTPEKIEKYISELSPDKACGADEVRPYVLKMCANEVAKPLIIIFSRSLEEGSVPEHWKIANLTSIFKKGNRTEPSNYRFVSLTSVVCRVMERMIRDSLMSYLEKEELVSKWLCEI